MARSSEALTAHHLSGYRVHAATELETLKTTGIAACCARGAIGHAAAALIGVLTVK